MLILCSGYVYGSGAYFQSDFGYRNVDVITKNTNNKNDPIYMSFNFGYLYQDILGIELGYTPDSDVVIDNETLKLSGFDFALRPQYKFDENIYIYAKVGVFSYALQSDTYNDDSISSSLSLGVEYELNKNWSVTSSMQYIDQIGSSQHREFNLYTYNFGIKYKFNDEPVNNNESSVVYNNNNVVELVQAKESFEFSILFGHDEHGLSQQSISMVYEKLIDFHEEDKDIEKITIEGYSNSIGESDYNMKLSNRRANNISNIISDYLHYPLDSINIIAHGEKFILKDENNQESFDNSRRVNVNIIYKDNKDGI